MQKGTIFMELDRKGRPLNRDVIKYIAMFTMLLNHVAEIFLPGGILYGIFLNVGFFTAVVMCYFMVEGYQYTHSKKKYLQRLILFAVISQIPYSLAFARGTYIEFQNFSMMTTLTLCFLILLTLEQVKNKPLKILLILFLIFLTYFCDWPLLAPIYTLLFVWAQNSERRLKAAFFLCTLLEGVYAFSLYITFYAYWESLGYTIYAMAGVALGGLCILFLYNGKRIEKGQKFSKWFFYFFYPGHLLILGIIRIAAGL